MILRLNFPEGTPLEARDMPKMHEKLVGILAVYQSDITIPAPGTYNITPTRARDLGAEHELTILDDGEGLYRMYPRYEDMGTVEVRMGAVRPFQEGGKQTRINDQRPFAVVAAAHAERPGFHIFEVIAFAPEEFRPVT